MADYSKIGGNFGKTIWHYILLPPVLQQFDNRHDKTAVVSHSYTLTLDSCLPLSHVLARSAATAAAASLCYLQSTVVSQPLGLLRNARPEEAMTLRSPSCKQRTSHVL